jgi:hypothetical protein
MPRIFGTAANFPFHKGVSLLTFAEWPMEVNFFKNTGKEKPAKVLIQTAQIMAVWVGLNR